MRTPSEGPGADSEQAAADPERWLVGELRSGIESWDPGSAVHDRGFRRARRRRLARRRFAVTAGLAAVACALLVFEVLPDSGITAGDATGSVTGVQTPAPSVEPAQSPVSASAGPVVRTATGPVVAAPSGQPQQTHAPRPGSATPLERSRPGTPAPTPTALTGRKSRSPDPSSSPSPSPSGGPTPICILGLLCL